MPILAVEKWRKLAIKEKHVQRAVLDYLAAEGILAIRLNSGVAERDGRRIALAPEGTADIVAQIPSERPVCWPPTSRVALSLRPGGTTTLECWAAIICWIECKKPARGTLSAAQRAFRELVEREGAPYIKARSLDDVMRVIPPKKELPR